MPRLHLTYTFTDLLNHSTLISLPFLVESNNSLYSFLRLSSPERPGEPLPELHIPLGGSAVNSKERSSSPASPDDSRGSSPAEERGVGPLYVPEVEEIRISPVVSRKGLLNVLDDRTNTWIKRWVVSLPHPHLFIFVFPFFLISHHSFFFPFHLFIFS